MIRDNLGGGARRKELTIPAGYILIPEKEYKELKEKEIELINLKKENKRDE